MTEYGWTDKQKAEYQRLTEEYIEHPICCKCGKPLDKGPLEMRPSSLGVSMFSMLQGMGMEICCADCGLLYRCTWGDLVLAFDALNGEPLQKKVDMVWANYADMLAKKAHPDWWDFTTMKPVRKEEIE